MTAEVIQAEERVFDADRLCSRLDGDPVQGPRDVVQFLQDLDDEALFAAHLTADQSEDAMDGRGHWADLKVIMDDVKQSRKRIADLIDEVLTLASSTPLSHETIDLVIYEATSQGLVTTEEASIAATRLGLFSKE